MWCIEHIQRVKDGVKVRHRIAQVVCHDVLIARAVHLRRRIRTSAQRTTEIAACSKDRALVREHAKYSSVSTVIQSDAAAPEGVLRERLKRARASVLRALQMLVTATVPSAA